MARRKGKSGRRVQNLQQRYDAGEDVEEQAGQGRRLSARGVKLREDAFAAGQDLDRLEHREGMIVAVYRRGAYIRMDGRRLFCGLAKTFRAPEGASPLAVGDVVTVALAPEAYQDGRRELDRERMDGMILARRPRETALVRPEPRSGKRRDAYDDEPFHKVIAANVDALLIVASTCQPPLHHGLIDRFLIAAQRGELEPLLAINKIDLAEADPAVLDDYRALDVRIVPVSAVRGDGLDALRAALAAKRTVLAGASGVGKSTLINALIPGAEAATGRIRAKDERGRHTTSDASVYDLPGGGMLVDTPGIRELGVHMDAAELSWFFPEFQTYARQCRFNDCTHTHEPGCAVREAVERGELNPRRFEGYLRIFETIEHQ